MVLCMSFKKFSHYFYIILLLNILAYNCLDVILTFKLNKVIITVKRKQCDSVSFQSIKLIIKIMFSIIGRLCAMSLHHHCL